MSDNTLLALFFTAIILTAVSLFYYLMVCAG